MATQDGQSRDKLSTHECNRRLFKPLCKYCGGRTGSAARGLCCVCYAVPDIRALYPAMTEEERIKKAKAAARLCRKGQKSVFNNTKKPKKPTTVCLEPPGSKGRIETYQQRIEDGEEIFNPLDAPADLR